jgi:hypothetical protein
MKNQVSIALSLVALTNFIIATSKTGISISSIDSMAYLTAAENLANHFSLNNPANDFYFFTWPPLYPFLISIPIFLGASIKTAALIINGISYSLLIYSFVLYVFRKFENLWVQWFCSIVAVFFFPFYQTATLVLSENVFILLVFYLCISAEKYIASPSSRHLSFLILISTLMCLQRFIGITSILFGSFVIALPLLKSPRYFFDKKIFKKQSLHLIIYVFLSALPLCIYMLRNYWLVGSIGGQRNETVKSFASNWLLIFQNFAYLFSPFERFGQYFNGLVMICILIGAAFAQKARLHFSLLVFAFFYLLCLSSIASVIHFDGIGFRLLSPVSLLSIVIEGIIFEKWVLWAQNQKNSILKTIFLILILSFFALLLAQNLRNTLWHTIDRI